MTSEAPLRLLFAICLLVALGACQHGPAVSTEIVQQRVDPAAIQAPRTSEDSMFRAAMLLADSTSALVDTIVVTPASLHLQTGDSIPAFESLRLEARGRDGRVLPDFAPHITVEKNGVVLQRRGYLVARAAGTALLTVRATQMVGQFRSARSHAAETNIPITVTGP
jgi:hypothetical protein